MPTIEIEGIQRACSKPTTWKIVMIFFCSRMVTEIENAVEQNQACKNHRK